MLGQCAELSGEVIVDLILVPGIVGRGICEDPAQTCVVYATRSMQGRAGRVLLFDPATLAQKELHFPGPVRTLAIHAGTMAGTLYVPPGLRVFGILDEERCGGPECGGVIAVNSMTGEIELDSAKLPMLPIESVSRRTCFLERDATTISTPIRRKNTGMARTMYGVSTLRAPP